MKYIYLENGVEKYPIGRAIIQKLSHFNFIANEAEFDAMIHSKDLSFTQQKEYLYIGIKRGKFLKEYFLDSHFKRIREEYYLTFENNCPMNCLYCYLREYYKDGAIRFYVNFDDMFKELDGIKNHTVSCGIVNDSLALEKLTGALPVLINYFANREDLTLEIRSKHVDIETLLSIIPTPNVEVAFTFSPQDVIDKYEYKTASLEKRIEATKALQERGYTIGLRLDPLIYIEDFDRIYCEMIQMIFSRIDIKSISSIGVGSLRYRKGLKKIVNEHHPTDLFLKDFVIGVDGKERYFKPIRLKMYKTIINEIKKYGDYPIYLGMESESIWNEVFK